MLLALLLVLPALAPPGAASVRQQDFDQASEDTSIFPAILARTVDATTRMLEASAAEEERHEVVREQAADVQGLLGTFDEELLEAIQTRGTVPARLASLQADYERVSTSVRQIVGAQAQLRSNRSALPEDPRGLEAVNHLKNALSALKLERRSLSDLSSASGDLTAYGIDPTALREAIDARQTRLTQIQDVLEEELALLRLPALLLMETDRRTVRLGGRLVVSGLALDGGEPATSSRVEVSMGPLERSVRIDDEGRYRAGIRIPLDLDRGSYDVEATASINGTDQAAGPVPIEVLVLRPIVTLRPATTLLAERSPLGFEGRVSVGPLDPGDRDIAVLVDGRPVANATTDDEGRFEGVIEIKDWMGGPHYVRARLAPADDRLAPGQSAPVRIFVPPTLEQRQETEGGPENVDRGLLGLGGPSQIPWEEFGFPSTGLGPVVDILAGLMLLGLSVLVAHALLTGRGRMTVQGLRQMIGFPTLTRFRPATEEEKRAADPRNAFPPSERALAGREAVGPVFGAFLEALREFEDDLPNGVTHRELAVRLVEQGISREEMQGVVRLYERAQYYPTAGERREEAWLLLERLEEIWDRYVSEQVEEPEGGRWWPWAPARSPGGE